jgi:uncharacterized protein (DUF1015 family)
MSRIKAFNGVYFSESKAGHISKLICPPYDIISPDENRELRRQNEYNTINVELAESGDAAFYQKSANYFKDWLNKGVLARSEKPSIYFYETGFSYHMAGQDRQVKRQGFFALLGVSDYDKGEILRHEHTLKGPKMDRLQLLRTARTNTSPIFVLYPDKGLKMISILAQAKNDQPVYEFTDKQGIYHKFFAVSDEQVVKQVTDDLAVKSVYIADGHHRYETALNFSKELKENKDPQADAAAWVMTYFCPMEDPGLVIFPYHRLVRNLPADRLAGLVEKLGTDFSIETLTDGFDEKSAEKVFAKLEGFEGKREFVLIDTDRKARLLKLKPEKAAAFEGKLDVEVFKELILEGILHITQQEITEKSYVAYETSENLIVKRLKEEDFQLAFLLHPIPVNKVVACADRAGVMPQKSTYFYPKLPTGLIFRRLG